MLLSDGLLDFGSVDQPSLGHEFTELNWVVEDFGPFFDGGNVFVHAFTGLDSVWKHPDNLANVFDTSDEFQVLEIIEGLLGFIDNWFLAFEAALKLNEVVVSGQAVNESSCKVGNCIQGWKAYVNL